MRSTATGSSTCWTAGKSTREDAGSRGSTTHKNLALAHRIENFWRGLGNGRLKRGIEAIGDRLFPKSYLYYCVKTDEGIRRAARAAPSATLPAPDMPAAGSDS